MLCGNRGHLLGLLLGLELNKAVANRGLAQPSALGQGLDVGGDVVAVVHELRVGADDADELVAGHLRLARRPRREAGDEVHDVVVVDVGLGKEDELEVGEHQLIRPAVVGVGLGILLFQLLGRLEILAPEAAQVVFGQHQLDFAPVLLGEVGVLIELRLEALHLFELVHEGGAGRVALDVGHL